MLTDRKKEEFLRIAMDLVPVIDCTNKHVTFIVRRGRIISIGTNSTKTHPQAAKLGYRLLQIHSELAALLNARGRCDLSRCDLINIRLSSISNNYIGPVLRNSRPCSFCMPWCMDTFRRIYYTVDNGWCQIDN